MAGAAQIRAGRLQELTKMALNGKTLDEIRIRAQQMASPPVAEGYVEEVLRRIQSIKQRNK